MARRYRCRPSALLGLDDPVEALSVDQICYRAGVAADAAAIRSTKAMPVVDVVGG